MSTRKPPGQPSLENLRKQAKDLLKALRRGDPAAAERLVLAHPRAGRRPPVLADAQLVLAREHGSSSWPALVRHLALGAESRALHRLDRLFREIPGARSEARPLLDVLAREADALRRAHDQGDPAARSVPALLGRFDGTGEPDAAAANAPLTEEHARDAVARWHRFTGWSDAGSHADRAVDPAFESAADAIVDGDADALRALLARHPGLAAARSPFAHRAGLLHHVAANGIEDSRQWQTPPNASALARQLLAAGAEPDAMCDCYGGATALVLIVSSIHPVRAGVQVALVDALIDGGASPDGPDGDGAPLRTALASGYLRAAEALARRGARADDLVAAAGLGRLERVRAAASGGAADVLGRALLAAGKLGHPAVVAELLDRGADPSTSDEQGFTPLHWAAWRADLPTMAILIERGAPLEAVNAYGGTVLGSTLWAASNAADLEVDHAAAVEALLAAGADLGSLGGVTTGLADVDEVLRRHGDRGRAGAG